MTTPDYTPSEKAYDFVAWNISLADNNRQVINSYVQYLQDADPAEFVALCRSMPNSHIAAVAEVTMEPLFYNSYEGTLETSSDEGDPGVWVYRVRRQA